MKVMIYIILFTVVSVRSAEIHSKVPMVIELNDQYDRPQKISFPSTNIIFLIVADREGSEQISPWTSAIKKQFTNSISIRGIADVSSVPKALRPFVRNKYQKAQPYPVMMDWSGKTVKALAAEQGKANVFVLSGQGDILYRYAGAASKSNITFICDALHKTLSNSVPKMKADVAIEQLNR